MQQHPCRVYNKAFLAPFFPSYRLKPYAGIFISEIKLLQPFVAKVSIVNLDKQHRVFEPLLSIVVLKIETELAGFEKAHTLREDGFLEAELAVKGS